MTIAFSDARELPLPPETAWAALTDWSRAGVWMPGVERMSADGPPRVGTVLTFTARGRERTSTVTAVDPGHAITLSSRQPGVRADYRYTVEATGSGSTVALAADVVASGPMRLLGGVIRSAIAKEDGAQLERFAAMLAG